MQIIADFLSDNEEDLSEKGDEAGATMSFGPAEEMVCDDNSSMPYSIPLSFKHNEEAKAIVEIQ
jgi:hypothetical protein